MDFNEENLDTSYKSGNQGRFEGTFAKHFRLGQGEFGAGATGYVYRQLTGDSGAGASLGSFKAEANGIGPVLSYIKPLGKQQLTAELKWLHEFDNKNRPEGDIVFLKVMYKF